MFTLDGPGSRGSATQEFAPPSDPAVVLHTAGTTSRPKWIPLSHANICTGAHNLRLALQLDSRDCCLNVMPLFHTHGLLTALLVSLVAGGSVVCMPGFAESQFFAALAECRPTWYTAAPTLHQLIVACAPQHRQAIEGHPLRFIRSGSAPLPASVLAELEHLCRRDIRGNGGLGSHNDESPSVADEEDRLGGCGCRPRGCHHRRGG
jgi:acyl-CoA synthetase (AMP-forming)/AMP-acid ligase II